MNVNKNMISVSYLLTTMFTCIKINLYFRNSNDFKQLLGVKKLDKEIREPKQKRSIEKKEKIIAAGYKLFIENGYFDITTADIAKAAGLSTGTVYAYFKDKKDVLLAALYRNGENFKDNIFNEFDKFSEAKDIFNIVKNMLHVFINLHNIYPKKSHDELMALVFTDEDFSKYFEHIKNAMMDALVDKLENFGITLSHRKEQFFLIYSLVEKIEDQLVFNIDPSLNNDIIIDECARVIVEIIQEK